MHTLIKDEKEEKIYLEKAESFLQQTSCILEYECGKGDLLNNLKDKGFQNLTGYDLSPDLIDLGKKSFPDLDLRVLKESGKIPLQNESIDAVILSFVISSIVEEQKQLQLIIDIFRVLKKQGILYLNDFLISHDANFKETYENGWREHGDWGLHKNGDVLIRHHSTKAIMNLLNNFDIHWFEQFDCKTNRIFHCIAQKR